jgi:integrase/recombinase XerD
LQRRGDAPAAAPVFQSVRRPGSPLTERAVNYIVKDAAERAGVNPAASVHWLRHAHASHAIDNGAPITLVSATLGHADLKTTNAGWPPCRIMISVEPTSIRLRLLELHR